MGRTPVTTATSGSGWERRAAVNVVFSMIAQVSSKVMTFAWTAVAARQLDQRAFGSFNFALSLGLLLAAIAEWGFDTALVQRVSRRPDDATELFSRAVACEAIVAVPLFAVVGAITAGRLHGSAAKLALVLVLVATVVDTFSDTIRGVAAGLQHQRTTATALTVGRVVNALVAIPVLLLGGGLVGLAISLLASYALGLVLHVVALRQLGVSLRVGAVRHGGLRTFVRGTAAFGVSTLVLAALSRFDVVLLEAMKGAEAVADYSASYKLFDTVLFLTFAVNGALFPVMSAQSDDKDEMARTLATGIVLVTAVYMAFAAVSLVDARAVLSLLFGSKYANASAGALHWLAAAPLVFSVSFLLGSSLAAVRRPRGLVVSAVAATIVNVAGDLLVIPHFSGAGAAAMTVAGYGTEAVLLYVFYRRAGGASLRLASAVGPVAGALAALVVILVALPGPPMVAVVAGLIIYAVLWTVLTRRWHPEQFELFERVLRRRSSGGSDPAADAPVAPRES